MVVTALFHCVVVIESTTMKKLKKQNHTKVALFAGATALMALTTNNVPGNSQSHALHAMADILWKF
jgi:hypothetical protein